MYISRKDEQIKLKGYRIEPQEVANSLKLHGDVKDATVIFNKESQCLYAYFLANDFVPSEQELFQFIKDKLPKYMIPKNIIHLDKFPLTKNGKLDTASLPLPQALSNMKKENQTTTHIQKILCRIWGEVLGKDNLSINDNFFTLGGDSIMSILMIGKAKQEGIMISLKDIYEYPTIESLEPFCKIEKTASKTEQLQTEKKISFPLAPVQKWFFSQKFEEMNHYNQSSLIKLNSDLQKDELYRIIHSLLSRHDVFFLNFKYELNNWVQIISDKLQITIETYSLDEHNDPINQIEIFEKKAQQSLNIFEGPIGKILIFETHQNSYILFVFHHLIIDWVSWSIFLSRVEQLINGAQLPIKQNFSYFKWIDSLNEYFLSEQFQQDTLIWKAEKYLSIESKILFSKNKKKLPANELLEQLFDENITSILQKITRKSDQYKLTDFIISALCLAFSDWSQNKQCYMLLESHGRMPFSTDQHIFDTIGWFTSMYPILFEIEQTDLMQIVQTVHKTLGEVPALGIAQKIQEPIPPICFNFLGNNIPTNYHSFEILNNLHLHNISNKNHLPFLFNINAYFNDDKLKLDWYFNNENISNEIANNLIKKCDFYLKEIVKQFFTKDQKKHAYALAPLQQGLLYNMLKSPDNSKYLIQKVFELSPTVHMESLKKAWIHTINQFDILRNGFMWSETPSQFTVNQINVNWIEIEVNDSIEQLTKIFLEEKYKPFDLSQPPLMRFLICKDKNKIYLAWTLLHLIIDGWSTGIILEYVENTYKEICTGKIPTIKPIKSFKSYIEWIEQSDKIQLNKFWSNYLDNLKPSFITETSRLLAKSTESSKYENLDYKIDAKLTHKLREKAKSYGVTLNAIIQAAWSIFLQQHLKTKEITFGITVSGRVAELEGIETIAGVFINTLPLRIKLENFSTFREVCKYAHQKTTSIQLNGAIPLHEIQSFLKDQKRKDLFDHILVFENFPFNSQNKDKILISSKNYVSIVETEYPLTIVFMPEEEIKMELSYISKFFDKKIITNLANQFTNILNSITQKEDLTLDNICLSNPDELRNIWSLFNETALNNLPSLSQLMKSCSLNLSKAALIENDKTINFYNLKIITDYIAAKIQNRTSIGVLLNRSIYFPIAALSCIKAKVPFVPIDTESPKERINFILQDAKCDFIITTNSNKDILDNSYDILCIDQEPWKNTSTVSNIEISNTEMTVQDDNRPAYIIYTSGSSGKPKGVIISRKALANYLHWCLSNYVSNNTDGSILHSSIAFDMSITALFVPYLTGQTLHIVPAGQEIRGLIQLLKEDKKFSFLKLTPSHLKILNAESMTNHINDKVSNLILGGEQLFYEDIVCFLNQEKSTTIFNEYGPTEATVGCCVYKCQNKDKYFKGPVPIGKPIFNTSLHVLNDKFQPCSILEEGELYIGGHGLAEGYTDYARNHNAFVHIPLPLFLDENSILAPSLPSLVNHINSPKRMYRTGDNVLLSPEMELVYTGRIGRQVKLNGYRIELEEIESVLCMHGDVKAAILDFDKSNQLLKAYFVPKEFAPSEEELKSYLTTKLPPYMIPSYYIQIDEIPLNSNGKVDLQKLRGYGTKLETNTNKKIPLTRLEFELHSLWLKTLDKQLIGIEDNFFSLGGHSILALQMLTEIKKIFGDNLSLQDFLVNPTIKTLASLLENRHKEVNFPIWLPFCKSK